MRTATRIAARASSALHQNILDCLVVAYTLAAIWPAPGDALRGFTFEAHWGVVAGPSLLLAILLFVAGLGIQLEGAAAARCPRQWPRHD